MSQLPSVSVSTSVFNSLRFLISQVKVHFNGSFNSSQRELIVYTRDRHQRVNATQGWNRFNEIAQLTDPNLERPILTLPPPVLTVRYSPYGKETRKTVKTLPFFAFRFHTFLKHRFEFEFCKSLSLQADLWPMGLPPPLKSV